jgi:hypothetical protein
MFYLTTREITLGGKTMSLEDKLSGATMAMAFLNAYISTVGEEYGMEKAISLLAKMCEKMGVMQGQMMKEQAGVDEIDLKTAWSIANTIPEGLGISPEIIEETPEGIVGKYGPCPVYSAGQMLGMDHSTIEELCRNGSATLMNTLTQQLNPNLKHELKKFRVSADDFCEEAIVKD